MRKKKWATPLLTVVVRGKPEEWVLSACKFEGPPAAADMGLADGCDYYDGGCYSCDSRSES